MMNNASIHLRVEQAQSDPMPPAELEIPVTGATLGRSAACTHCLLDTQVSRRHARVARHEGRWVVSDLGSSGGTRINGVQIDPHVSLPLVAGDRIEIGPWRFRVRAEGDQLDSTLATLTGESTKAVSLKPSRRLEALSACIDQFVRSGNEDDLAHSALTSAISGAGYRRGAILRPPSHDGHAEILAALEREGTVWHQLASDDVRVPRALVQAAASGQTATLSSGVDQHDRGYNDSATIAQEGIHSAVCVPVFLDARVVVLLYLDSRSGEAPIQDGAGFCEDVARLYGLAIAYSARSELQRRQAEVRVELERARVLRDMLAPEPLIDTAGYRIAHLMRAGQLVSGDLFDVLPLLDGHAAVLFGDASGHGVGAAMLSALAQSHLIAELTNHGDVRLGIERTNRFIASRETRGSFLSLWGGRLSPDGEVGVTDAGHGHWIILRCDGGDGGSFELAPDATGMPIGIDPDATQASAKVSLAPGDRILLYTDGLCEAHDQAGNQIGADGIKAVLSGSCSAVEDIQRISDLLDGLTEAVVDDATVTSIEYRGH